jgi:ParB family chromosome partitioning protein
MNATVTIKEEVRTNSLVREIPLDKIQESKTNPRTHFDEGALAELAANIKEHGVLQPVLLRSRANGASESYELVVGSRRYRASKLARRETIPATIRELTDTQVVELQLVENLLREEVHELDEASGYAALQKLNPSAYTVETIALKVSRSPRSAMFTTTWHVTSQPHKKRPNGRRRRLWNASRSNREYAS